MSNPFNPETKILVVDDLMTMRKIIKKSLIDMGFKHVEEADDGNKAWTKIVTSGNIGLIIADWNMPNCNGLELLKRLRGDAKHNNIPYILLTAEGEASQVKAALSAGVDGYILKPFATEALKDMIIKSGAKRSGAA